MVVTADDIKLYKSTNGHGGARTDNETSATVNDWFDQVTGEESSAGDTEYRVLYVRNESATTAVAVKVHLTANYESADGSVTTSAGDISIGVNTAKNTAAPTPTDEDTAPTGVTFSNPANRAAGIDIGDLAEDEYRAIFVRRITDAGASAKDDATVTLRTTLDTAE